VKMLLELGKALHVGPTLYKGLKDMDNKNDDERVEVLTEQLMLAGAVPWKGKIPTSNDILKAKIKRQREDDLGGIDTSFIIDDHGKDEGEGRRGGSRSSRR